MTPSLLSPRQHPSLTPCPGSGSWGSQGLVNHSNTCIAPPGAHVGWQQRPFVSGRIAALHRSQIAGSIIPSNHIQEPIHCTDPCIATVHVHVCHLLPGVCSRIINLNALYHQGPIEPTCGIQLSAENPNPCATAVGAHVRHVCPCIGLWVVLLHGAQALAGSPIITPNSTELSWTLSL